MRQIWLPLLFLFLLINACAFDVVRIDQTPVHFRADTEHCRNFILKDQINFTVGPGYKRTLKQGTRWICTGAIEQGSVFKTMDQVLTIEASNIYEANIVVTNQTLIGFYLPVEQSFYDIGKPQKLAIEEINEQ